MKLRNKKTGEIVEDSDILALLASSENDIPSYRSLAEFNDDWEDYEEPNEFWFINECGEVRKYKYNGECSYPIVEAKLIGNYFKTKEEAEKTVEKLKAWKRLKDKGFRFEGYKPYGTSITFTIAHMSYLAEHNMEDLELLFGDE